MQKSLYFNGQDVLMEDVNNTESTKSAELARRLLDTARSFGVVLNDPTGNDTTLKPTSSGSNLITVSPGSAYDGNGDYINYPGPSTDPVLTIAFANIDVGNYIVLRYLASQNTAVNHPVTGASNNTRQVDSATNRNADGTYTGTFYQGWTLLNVSSPLATDVRLCQIIAVDGVGGATLNVTPGYSTDSTSARFIYSARVAANGPGLLPGDPLAAMIAHINNFGAIGHSVPHNAHGLTPADIGVAALDITAHQRDLHGTGIARDDADNPLSITVVGGLPNSLTLLPITTGDHLVIFGVDVKNSINGYNVTFADGTVNAAMYEIWMDSTGLLSKFARATYPNPVGSLAVPNVHLVNVSHSHSNGPFALAWNGTTKTLSWDGGPPITIANSSNFNTIYRLFRGNTSFNSFNQYIDVYVRATALFPISTGSINITLVNSVPSTEQNLFIGTIFWGGSSDGHLGYGQDGVSGLAYDKRVFGNLGYPDLRDDTVFQIEGRFAETRSNGFVLPTGTNLVSNPSGLSITVVAAVWYVGGRRTDQVNTISLTAADNTTNYVYFSQFGGFVINAIPPATYIPPGSLPSLSTGSTFLVATAVALSGAITSLVLNCPNLFDLDNNVATLTGLAKLHTQNVFDYSTNASLIPNIAALISGGLSWGLAWGVESRTTPTTTPATSGGYFGIFGADLADGDPYAGIVNGAVLDGSHVWHFGNAARLKANRLISGSDGIYWARHTDIANNSWSEGVWANDMAIVKSNASALTNNDYLAALQGQQGAKIFGIYYWDGSASNLDASAGSVLALQFQGGPTLGQLIVTWSWNLSSGGATPFVPMLSLLKVDAVGDVVRLTSSITNVGSTGFTLTYETSAGAAKSLSAGNPIMISYAVFTRR